MPWGRTWQPTPVFSPGEAHGQRSLAGCSPWGHKESDTTEQLKHTCSKLTEQQIGRNTELLSFDCFKNISSKKILNSGGYLEISQCLLLPTPRIHTQSYTWPLELWSARVLLAFAGLVYLWVAGPTISKPSHSNVLSSEREIRMSCKQHTWHRFRRLLTLTLIKCS